MANTDKIATKDALEQISEYLNDQILFKSASAAAVAMDKCLRPNNLMDVVDIAEIVLSIDPSRVYEWATKKYFTFEVVSLKNNIARPKLEGEGAMFYYSKNGGPWVEWTKQNFWSSDNDYVVGDVFRVKGENVTGFTYGSSDAIFKLNGCKVYGNVMSLFYGDDFENQTELPCSLQGMFYQTDIVDAEMLVLPSLEIEERYYGGMFTNCYSLVKGPSVLPATTVGERAYQGMFSGCRNMVSGPSVLPATTVPTYAYSSMFGGCTALLKAPEILATTVGSYGCSTMFSGCAALTTAPELPATTLASYAYNQMFQSCTSLVKTPSVLPADLSVGTENLEGVYYSMFSGCTSIDKSPDLPSSVIPEKGFYTMFMNCTSLRNIKCLATDFSNSNCLSSWVYGVPTGSAGTFTKATAAVWPTGYQSGIPSGWTVIDV